MEQMKFTDEYISRFAECDKKYDLKPSALLAWAADTAGHHLDSRGITREQMWQDGQVFLLTRAAINYNSVPYYNVPVNLTTWENKIKGSQFVRKFALTDENGNIICDMETMWVLVNPESHKICRPKEYPYTMLFCEDETAAKIEKWKAENYEYVKDYTFVYSDIDPNGHVNNGTYLRLMSDIIPEELINRHYKSLNINFARECMQGNSISLYFERQGDICFVKGEKEDGTVSFEIKAEF